MGKPTICIGENKGADQLRSNCEADQHFCFRYSDSTIPLQLKSSFLCLYRCVQKPHCWFSHEVAQIFVTAEIECMFDKAHVYSSTSMVIKLNNVKPSCYYVHDIESDYYVLSLTCMKCKLTIPFPVFNPYKENGFSHHYHLGESTFISRGVRSDLKILFNFSMKIL